MRKLILKMSMSVDGFVGGPNEGILWLLKSQSEDSIAWTVNTVWQAGVHIMGSRTFHDMASYWPYSTEPFAPPMNEIPKVVFTRNKAFDPAEEGQTTNALKDAMHLRGDKKLQPDSSIVASWTRAEVAYGDLHDEIMRLKQQPGEFILAHGGAGFAQSLVKSGLIDEYRLLIHPVALGSGLPIFSALSNPLDLELVETIAFKGGAVAHVYRPAGK